MKRLFALFPGLALAGAAPAADYDIVIRNGRVLDGTGNPWVRVDVAVAHGLNERIPVASFYEAIDHIHNLAVELGR